MNKAVNPATRSLHKQPYLPLGFTTPPTPPTLTMPPPSLPFYPPDASISITSYKTTFTPPSHTKHHGSERQVPQFIPSHIESDRDPRATEERRMRRNAHRDAIERDPNVFKGKLEKTPVWK